MGEYTQPGFRRVTNHPPSEHHHVHGIFTLTGSSPYISIVLEGSSCVLFVASHPQPGGHMRVTNHPPSEHHHVHPFGIALHIYLSMYWWWDDDGSMDDRLMDDHFIDHVLNYKKLLNFLTRARARVRHIPNLSIFLHGCGGTPNHRVFLPKTPIFSDNTFTMGHAPKGWSKIDPKRWSISVIIFVIKVITNMIIFMLMM